MAKFLLRNSFTLTTGLSWCHSQITNITININDVRARIIIKGLENQSKSFPLSSIICKEDIPRARNISPHLSIGTFSVLSLYPFFLKME